MTYKYPTCDVFHWFCKTARFIATEPQIASRLFNAVWKKLGTKRSVWENIRSLFIGYSVDSMEEILIALYYGFKKEKLLISGDPPPSWRKICRFSLKKWETRINLILILFTGGYGLYGELLRYSLNIFIKWVTFFTCFVLCVYILKTKSKKVRLNEDRVN